MPDPAGSPGWHRVWVAAHAGDLSGLAGDLAAVVAVADLAALAAAADELALLPALADAADVAAYWQEPDPVERALCDHQAQRALLPVARAVAGSPAARWWPGPVAHDVQQLMEPGGARAPVPLSGASRELAAWRSATVAEERSAADRPADPAARLSGHWWSAPVHARLAATTRSLPGLGAVVLAVVEDRPGWTEAWCQPVRPRPGARVYEITGPDDWAQLAGRYPLDVTRSRRHDWWRATGWAGAWLIPDYAAVAADYDAIHLTVLGYLTTAGRSLPAGDAGEAGDARTMLAGWEPDSTYWLTDSLDLAGPATRWEKLDDDPAGWVRLASGHEPKPGLQAT